MIKNWKPRWLRKNQDAPATTALPSKFYHVVNATRAVAADNFRITFHPYERTSTWLGVYSTANVQEQKALDELVTAGNKGVTHIDEAEYQRCLKKKHGETQGYSGSLAASTPMPGQAADAGFAGKPIDAGSHAGATTPPEASPEDVTAAVAVERKTAS